MASPLPYLSPEKYFEIERGLESKNEYIDGVMYAMSGGGLPHSEIAGRWIAALRARLAQRRCSVFTSDAQVGISPTGPFLYPDVSVACDGPRTIEHRSDVLANPLLIVEVLSPSTEAYDRGKKFAFYRRIESLREYVLVSQTEPRIEVFQRDTEGTWKLSEFVGWNAVCRLQSADCAIPLSEIYRDVLRED